MVAGSNQIWILYASAVLAAYGTLLEQAACSMQMFIATGFPAHECSVAGSKVE